MITTLDKLVEDGDLAGKEYGKSKIYLLNQDKIPKVDEKDMEKMKNGMNRRKKEMEELQTDCKDLKTTLANVSAELTNEEIKENIIKTKKMV